MSSGNKEPLSDSRPAKVDLQRLLLALNPSLQADPVPFILNDLERPQKTNRQFKPTSAANIQPFPFEVPGANPHEIANNHPQVLELGLFEPAWNLYVVSLELSDYFCEQPVVKGTHFFFVEEIETRFSFQRSLERALVKHRDDTVVVTGKLIVSLLFALAHRRGDYLPDDAMRSLINNVEQFTRYGVGTRRLLKAIRIVLRMYLSEVGLTVVTHTSKGSRIALEQ
jgi:hypothetical protein